MKRNLSAQLLDGLSDAALGPNQRMTGQAAGVGNPKQSRDPQQRPLLNLLGLISGLSVVASVLIVALTDTPADALPALAADVLTFRRVPANAQDNVAAVVAFLASLVPLVFVDYTVCAAVCSDAGGRWFLLHALGNLVVAGLALPDFYFWAKEPPLALSSAYCEQLPFPGCSDWPTCIIIAMHVYHMVSFKLSSDDLFHHLLFVPLIGGIKCARCAAIIRSSAAREPHARARLGARGHLTPLLAPRSCAASSTRGASPATSSASSSPASPAGLIT
jgi:hypothetical protein